MRSTQITRGTPISERGNAGLWAWRFLAALGLAILALAFCRAQQPQRPSPPPPPPEAQESAPQAPLQSAYTIQRSVDMVVLHVSVTDEHGQFVAGLKPENFRLFEDDAEQKISVVRQEDVPVSMGLLIDNSGSMDNKREKVNAAALTFVKTSNPEDEVFVAHFNDRYFFDQDFTHDFGELNKALQHDEPDGSTALYDAAAASLNHLRSGYMDKKVLLIVSDGEDNSSQRNLASALTEAQKSSALIYAIGLLREEVPESAERDRQALTALTRATGGAALFPEDLQDVEASCNQIAREIRHQYTLAYYPANTRKDGSFRTLRVEIVPPAGDGKIMARTRTGYYAQRAESGN